MGNICILLQCILSFHIFYSALTAERMAFGIVGSIIVHLIIYLVNHLCRSKKMSASLYIIDIILLILMAYSVNEHFGLLAASINVEFIARYKYRMISNFILPGYLFITNGIWLREQWLLFVLLIFFLSMLFKYEEKIKSIKRNNEDLRDKLYHANIKLESIQKEASHIEEAAKLQERNILVQKLHDKIGHTLAANIMQLEAVKIILQSNIEEAGKMLALTIENLRNGMDDIRHTLKDIKPECSEVGLNQIRYILEDLQNTHGIETEFLFEGDVGAISLSIWHVTLQNLKETITNLLKYSKADRFTVRIEVFHKIIKIQFKDNGTAIEQYENGLGLMGIEERTQSINGRLVINTNSGFETLMILKREDI
ncbi:sensor histidine kinase [Cellulosilyticum sp. I15G10I2]|uniref:sensor histidine kinase n=1 Tax=Cellulosilyticum sp. I15G10I2 TaxID=1892843 RepID=UPI00085BF6EC|nr:histidine kinase [Cellulosilyticum sp. I15G10I2]